jgi:hypothetical protein
LWIFHAAHRIAFRGGAAGRFLFSLLARFREMVTIPPRGYITIGVAGLRLRLTDGQVRRRIQKGLLEGACIDGRWLVCEDALPDAPGELARA